MARETERPIKRDILPIPDNQWVDGLNHDYFISAEERLGLAMARQ